MDNKLSLKNLQQEDSPQSSGQARHQLRKSLLQKIKNSQKKIFWSSKEYKEVTASVEAFVHLSEQEPKVDSVLPLIQAHERLGKACETYLEAKEGDVTKYGRKRIAWVKSIFALHEAEVDGINSLRNRNTAKKVALEYSSGTWNDVLGKFRTPEITVSQSDVRRYKDGMSERLRIPFEGRYVFYSKSKPFMAEEEFWDGYMDSISDDGIKNLFLKEKEVFKSENGQAKKFLHSVASAAEEFNDRLMPGEEDAFRNEVLEVVRCYQPDPFSDTFRIALWNRNTRDIFFDLSNKYLEFARNKLIHQAVGLKNDQDILLHNAASSRIASLIGQPELLAESWKAHVTIDGERSSGICMEEAKGIECSNERMEELAQIKVIDTPEFQKSVSGLHLLDLLCGQLDRHECNMFYRAEQRNGALTAVGVQGIDNDVAFGKKLEIAGEGDQVFSYVDGDLSINFMVKLGTLNSVVAVDSTLAVNILSLDRAALNYALGDIIDRDQIEAVEDRLKQIKDHLWKLKLRNGWMEDHQWNENSAERMYNEADGGYYSRAKSVIDRCRQSVFGPEIDEAFRVSDREVHSNLKKH